MAGHRGASGFVNALLRRYLRERVAVLQSVDRSEPAMLAHPRWLLKAMREEPGKSAPQVIAANNESPPMTLRVNLQRTSRDAMIAKLAAAGLVAHPGLPTRRLVLEQPMDVTAHRLASATGWSACRMLARSYAASLLGCAAGRARARCLRRAGRQDRPHPRTHRRALRELVALDVDAERLDARGAATSRDWG